MRIAILLPVSVALLSSCASAHGKPAVASPNARTNVVAANNAFAIDLYRAAAAPGGSVVAGPGSIAPTLAMVMAGARGETAIEMQRVLHVAPDTSGADWGRLARDLRRNAAITIASRGWLASTFDIAPPFAETLRRDFEASFAPLDPSNAAAAAKTINQWIEQNTAGKITNLVPESAITPMTRLVLANAIHVKAKWQSPFKSNRTRPMPFHIHPDAVKPVPMMFQQGQLAYAEDDAVRVVELGYADAGDLALLLVVPKQLDGWKTLDAQLGPATIDRWTRALAPRSVSLFLPKWKHETSLDLTTLLKQLGMPTAFDESKADFSGMTRSKQPLFIGAALHKAFITVDELGTEAAAATAVTIEGRSLHVPPPDTVEVKADHPFLYLLRDRRSGAILFVGRVNDPA